MNENDIDRTSMVKDNVVVTLISGTAIYVDEVLGEEEGLIKIDPSKSFQIQFQQVNPQEARMRFVPLTQSPWQPDSFLINKSAILTVESISETSSFYKSLIKHKTGIDMVSKPKLEVVSK